MHDNSDFSSQINIEALRRGVIDACEDIAVALLGQPSYRDRREMRWGRKGSLALDLAAKRGLWYDHELADGGDIIALVERVLSCDFRSACAWLAGHTGVASEVRHTSSPAQPDAHRMSYARRLWAEGRPFAGSPGEGYFGGRGLGVPEPARLRLRYHEARCSVIAPFRHFTTHEVTGIQLIPIDGSRKTSHGCLKGSAVMLTPTCDGVLTVTEGVATAIGAMTKAVTHGAVWALGGTAGLSRFPALEGFDRLVIAADNDNGGRKAAEQVKQTWEAAGKTVLVRLPSGWGKDWADGE